MWSAVLVGAVVVIISGSSVVRIEGEHLLPHACSAISKSL